ncbi:MAG: response regulator transcription factor [Candidatus Blackburnbacteria bacterium]|nr:response regulator transcription factor [Candidatus Blackburnbacteria bacterium]
MNKRVFVITFAHSWANKLRELVGEENLVICEEHKGVGAVEQAVRQGQGPDVIFVNVETLGRGEAIAKLRRLCPDAQIIATGQMPIWSSIRAAFRNGANDFEYESVEPSALAKLVAKYIKDRASVPLP